MTAAYCLFPNAYHSDRYRGQTLDVITVQAK